MSKNKSGFWSGFSDSTEVKLTMLCTLIFFTTIVLGILTFYLGTSVITVDFHIRFDIAIGLILIVIGLSLTWIFITWYFTRMVRVLVDVRVKELATPIDLQLDEEMEHDGQKKKKV